MALQPTHAMLSSQGLHLAISTVCLTRAVGSGMGTAITRSTKSQVTVYHICWCLARAVRRQPLQCRYGSERVQSALIVRFCQRGVKSKLTGGGLRLVDRRAFLGTTASVVPGAYGALLRLAICARQHTR